MVKAKKIVKINKKFPRHMPPRNKKIPKRVTIYLKVLTKKASVTFKAKLSLKGLPKAMQATQKMKTSVKKANQ